MLNKNHSFCCWV